MDNYTQQTELIMRYLDGEMSGMEKDEFEKKLATDENMRRELEDLKTARDAVKIYGLKQQVASVRNEMVKEKPQAVIRKMSPRRIARYTLAAAASIALIIVCVLAYNFFTLSPDKLYNEKFNSFELSSLRGTEQSTATDIEKAYRQGNYKEVIRLSTQSPDSNTQDQFLTGVSFLELNKPSDAINFFNAVINKDQKSAHPVYRDEAEFYLALSYLKAKNYEKALDLMNVIHDDPSHRYHEKFTKGFIRRVKVLKLR